MQMVRFAATRLADKKPDERTWQPHILALSGAPTARWRLIEIADAIAQGKSLLTVATVVPSSSLPAERTENITNSIQQYLKKNGIAAMVKVYPADDPLEGARDLVKAYGLGPVVPNTILIGHTERPENFADYARLIQQIHATRRNLVVVRESDQTEALEEGGRIDVWWRGKRQNVGLMLALAFLLSRNPAWAASRLALKTIVPSEEEREDMVKRSKSFILTQRLNAETDVIVKQSGDAFETIRTASRDAGLVFLGMRAPEPDESPEDYGRYCQELIAHTEDLPPTAMVMAAEDVEFDRIFQ